MSISKYNMGNKTTSLTYEVIVTFILYADNKKKQLLKMHI